jgi:hypothetical protein
MKREQAVRLVEAALEAVDWNDPNTTMTEIIKNSKVKRLLGVMKPDEQLEVEWDNDWARPSSRKPMGVMSVKIKKYMSEEDFRKFNREQGSQWTKKIRVLFFN